MAIPAGKALTRLRQIVAEVETTPGVAETLVAADNIPRISNPRFAMEPLLIERDILRGTLTKLPKLAPGQTRCRVSFDVEMGGLPENEGLPASFTAPAWGDLLSGCGFQVPQGLEKTTIGAVTGGPFQHGETVTQTTSGATFKVIRDTYNGDAELFFDSASGTGTPDGTNVWTGGTSGATATPSTTPGSTVFGDHSLESDVDSFKTLTIGLYMDGKVIKLRGCMGNVQFVFQHGRPGLFRFEFLGALDSANPYTESANLTGVYDTQSTPPRFHSSDMNFSMTDGTLTITDATGPKVTLSELTVNMNNEVVIRDNSVAVLDGLDYAIVVNRAPAGSFNPDELDESVYDYFSSLDNATINRLDITLGQTSGNQFIIPMRGLQLTNLGDLDREGVFALDASFDLTGGDYGSGTHGNDNEIMFLDM